MTEKEALARWPTLPEHIREKNESKWADMPENEVRRRRKLVIVAYDRTQKVDPETGLRELGGAQPGSGRPRKKRVARRIAEHAQEERNARKLVKALFDGLNSTDERVVLRTAVEVARIEAKEEELSLREDEFDRKPEQELKEFLAKILAQLSASGQLPNMEELLKPRADVEATAVEIENDGITAA